VSRRAYAARKAIRENVPMGFQNLSRLMVHWCEEIDKCYQWNDAGMYNKEIGFREQLLKEFTKAYQKDQKEFERAKGNHVRK
jgi:hypothetical protein